MGKYYHSFIHDEITLKLPGYPVRAIPERERINHTLYICGFNPLIFYMTIGQNGLFQKLDASS